MMYDKISQLGYFASQGTFSNVWRHFWLSQLVDGESKNAAKHPTMHKTAPTAKNYSAPKFQ